MAAAMTPGTVTLARVDSAARPITLTEAVDLAQRNAPQVIEALGQRRTSAAAVRSAYASFIPSLNLTAGATRQLPQGARTRIENGQVITLPPQPWSYGLGLGASVDLFDGGRRVFDVQQARARSDAAIVHETTQRYSATLAVKQQYFDVLAARETEAAARAQMDQAEQQLRASVARVRARTATRSDSLRSEILRRTAQIAVTEARTAINVANASLTRAVGVTDLVTASPADTVAEADVALDETTLQQLADDGPVVAEAKAAVAAARAARRAGWAAYLPTVSTSYSRNGNAVGNSLFPNGDPFNYSGALRFSVSLPVFNQLQREEQRTQVDVAAVNAEAALRDARLAARQSLAQSLGAYRLARESVAAQTASVAAAEEDLRVQQQRYAVGGSTLLDVLTSETQLDQARRDLIRARYDQRVARAQLEALVGRNL
jgi:outer membrane protein